MIRPSWIRATAWIYFVLLFFFLALAGFLWKSGELLVRSDSFGHVRWAVVLAGENKDMPRSQAALMLFQDGRFDSLILSGPRVFRTHHESEFSSEWLMSQGFPNDRIFQLPHEERSTLTEAAAILKQTRLLQIDTLLVITSNYHSARAERIFEKLSGGFPVIRVYAADDPSFNPESWWSWRQSRVAWLLEWTKTVHTQWELWNRVSLPDTRVPILLEPNPRRLEDPSIKADSSSSVSNSETDQLQDTVQRAR